MDFGGATANPLPERTWLDDMTMRLLAALTALGLSAAATPPLPPTPARDPSDPFYTSYHFQPLKNWMNDRESCTRH